MALIWPTRIDTSHERLGCLGLTKSSMLSFFPLSFRGACQSKNIRSEIRAQRGTKHHGASKTCVKLILFHTRRQKNQITWILWRPKRSKHKLCILPSAKQTEQQPVRRLRDPAFLASAPLSPSSLHGHRNVPIPWRKK